MSKLQEYVASHVERGACTCGRCVDAPPDAANKQPAGHTADVFFFKVKAINDPDADTLKSLIAEHPGEYGPVNPLDGKEHSYIELGGYIGDQGLALMLMGLGTLLGLWQLLTPRMLPGLDEALAQQMAGLGMVTVKAGA